MLFQQRQYIFLYKDEGYCTALKNGISQRKEGLNLRET